MATVTGLTAAETNTRLGQMVVGADLDVDGSLVFTRENGASFEGGDFNAVVAALVQDAILNQTYPVGSIYFSTNSANPTTALGGGVWAAWGSGRVPVGFDGTQTEFNASEKTGGAKTVTLTIDQMPSHNHTQDPHGHVQAAHSHSIAHDHGSVNTTSAGAHTHTLYSRGGGSTSDLGSYPRIKRSSPEADPSYQSSDLMEDGSGAHTHSLNLPAYSGSSSSTTATNNQTTATNQAAGGGQSHPNLPPYITVHMWKRTG